MGHKTSATSVSVYRRNIPHIPHLKLTYREERKKQTVNHPTTARRCAPPKALKGWDWGASVPKLTFSALPYLRLPKNRHTPHLLYFSSLTMLPYSYNEKLTPGNKIGKASWNQGRKRNGLSPRINIMHAYHILGFWNGNTALNTIHGTTSKCFVEDNPHINKSKGLVLVWFFFFSFSLNQHIIILKVSELFGAVLCVTPTK